MKNALLLVLIFVSNLCYAQLTFGEHIIADDSFLPQGVTHVELGDMDGDGDQDMVTASEGDNKIAWFKNLDGLGSFGAQNVISLDVDNAQLVRVADLDSDGDMDVIGVALFDENIVGFYNDGNGNFNEVILVPSNNQDFLRVENVISADVNMDGMMDLVVLSGSDEILLYTNLDNEGNYSRSVIAETSNLMNNDLDVGDIDGDGDLDIVSMSETMFELSWHENTNGEFVTHEIDVEGINNHFELSDIEGDGDMDLVLGSNSPFNPRLSWVEFDGDFGTQHFLIDEDIEVGALDVADVNQDGKEDIILISRDLDEVVWLENIADGPLKYNYIANTLTFFDVLHVGDFNGDSYPDLFLRGDRWHTFLPDVNEFSAADRFETFTDGAYDVVSMDVDEDGDLDIISASTDDGRIGWYENVDGLGNYNELQILITDDVWSVTDIHLADLDGDGDLDIVGSIFWDNKVFWIRNDGGSIFSDIIIIDNDLPRSNSVDVGDIDGDGDMDIVVANIGEGFSAVSGNQVNWYRNENGLGSFSEANLILEEDGSIPIIVKLGDIDNDQDLDVICALGDGGVQWISNLDGQGMFADPTLISADDFSSFVIEIGDIDNDGDLDILSSRSFNEATQLYLNEDGQGSFSEGIVISDNSSSALKIVDLDQDGDNDIVAVRLTNFFMDVIWYDQIGELSFEEFTISQSPVLDGNNVDIADLDEDGDLDVISASISDDKIAWYENYDPVSTSDILTFQFTISPVPATTSLKIESDVLLDKAVIYNIEGKFQLLSHDVSKIDVSSLASGMFIIQVVDVDGNINALKFVKE